MRRVAGIGTGRGRRRPFIPHLLQTARHDLRVGSPPRAFVLRLTATADVRDEAGVRGVLLAVVLRFLIGAGFAGRPTRERRQTGAFCPELIDAVDAILVDVARRRRRGQHAREVLHATARARRRGTTTSSTGAARRSAARRSACRTCAARAPPTSATIAPRGARSAGSAARSRNPTGCGATARSTTAGCSTVCGATGTRGPSGGGRAARRWGATTRGLATRRSGRRTARTRARRRTAGAARGRAATSQQNSRIICALAGKERQSTQ